MYIRFAKLKSPTPYLGIGLIFVSKVCNLTFIKFYTHWIYMV